MDNVKHCAACRAEIHAQAYLCPNCRSRQPDAPPMHRGVPGRMVAGVCAAIALHAGVDASLVRATFAVAALFSGGVAFAAYLLLWAITPASAHDSPPMARAIQAVRNLFAPKRSTAEPPAAA